MMVFLNGCKVKLSPLGLSALGFDYWSLFDPELAGLLD